VTRRILVAAPLLAALMLYVGVASPLRGRAAQARDAFAQARRERHQVQARLAPLERRESARRQAAAAFAAAAGVEGGAAAAVRRAVLATAEQAGAARVRLGVRPGPSEVSVRLAASAPYAEAVRLPGDVARPETGLVLQRVRLERRPDQRLIAVEIEAVAPLGRP
jgi:hypothetical protein